MYANDTVILEESSADLQSALDKYSLYCKIWMLEINSSETEVMIFSKGRVLNYDFTIDGVSIEVDSEYKYLGVLVSGGGSFLAMK